MNFKRGLTGNTIVDFLIWAIFIILALFAVGALIKRFIG